MLPPVITFYIHLLNEISTFIVILALCSVVYAVLFWRYTYSLYDPFLLYIIGVSFSTADMWFMYSEQMIRQEYFTNYVLTQIAFVGGFYLVSPIRYKNSGARPRRCTSSTLLETNVFVVSSLLFVFSQITTYVVLGIPLFLSSRLLLYQGSGGLGILGRVMWVTSTVILYSLVQRYRSFGTRGALSKTYDVIVLLFIVASFILSGSRSALISIVTVIFFYILLHGDSQPLSDYLGRLRRLQKYLLCIAVIASLLIITYNIAASDPDQLIQNPFPYLMLRFVHFGDAFFIAYPDDIVPHLVRNNPFVVMFVDLLWMFRLIPRSEVPTPLGIQLTQYYVPDLYGVGPNPVMNLFGYFFFGPHGAVLYCFIIGYVVSYVRNGLILRLRRNEVSCMLYVLIVLAISAIPTDISLGLGYLTNVALVFPAVLFVSVILSGATRRSNVGNWPQGIFTGSARGGSAG